MTQDPLFQKSVKEVFDEIVGQHKSFPEYLSLLIDKKIRQGKDQLQYKDADEYFTKMLYALKHIQDKDFFLEYYKNHLAKRLLNGTELPDDEK